jgi:hypothetical protein
VLIPLYMLFGDHLPLRELTDHNSTRNQFVAYQMGCLMQAFPLLGAFLLGHALVDMAQMDIALRLLLTLVPFGTYLVQLLVISPCSLKAANTEDSTLFIDPRCQRLDTEIKCYCALACRGLFLSLTDKRSVVVPACIPSNGYFSEYNRWSLSKFSDNIGVAFLAMLTTSASRESNRISCNLDIHRRVAERKEFVPFPVAREAWRFSCLNSPIESFHGLVQAEIDFLQEFAIDMA